MQANPDEDVNPDMEEQELDPGPEGIEDVDDDDVHAHEMHEALR